MSNKLFKTLRTSYITGTLLTGILSNVMVFGQPIMQITQMYRNLDAKSSSIYHSSTYGTSTKKHVVTDLPTANLDASLTKDAIESNAANLFFALENQAVIGIFNEAEKENPRDNFFTVNLPIDLNLGSYDAVLRYQLYGVADASHTTKSINNSLVYGGKTIKASEVWQPVEERIPIAFLKNGENELFFNRRADETYLYKIKDLQIQLVKKDSEPIVLSTKKLKNYNGKIPLVGYVPKHIKALKVLGHTVSTHDGMFEYTLEGISKGTKTLEFSYDTENGHNIEKTFEVTYESESINYQFNDLTTLESTSQIAKSSNGFYKFNDLSIEETAKSNRLVANDLKIGGLPFKALKPLNSDVVNVTSGKFLGYRIGTARGKTDDDSLKIHLAYDTTKIPDGYGPQDVRVFSFDSDKREWVALSVDRLDYENKTVVADYNGDTDYINGVIKVPEMAETSSFTPTTITDMEYANPTAGVVSISPPSPNNNGIASTSFPIKLPAGRNGMMPNLSVNYNSEGGNGWMGLGWNLQLPAITLDTRWGVPRFDDTDESEIYQLNGETMVLKVNGDYTNPHRYNSAIPRATNRTFYLRKEGSYLEIIRYGSSPSNYYWEVTDKHGNKSFYGGQSSVESNSVITDEEGHVTYWALYKTVDPFGNYVLYEYDKDSTIFNTVSVQYFYPSKITYTLNETSNMSSYYEAVFLRTNTREDMSLSARTGTLVTTHELLDEIKINFNDGQQIHPIRSYGFDYTVSPFKKTQLEKISEYDAAGNLFYSNTIEYFDDIGSDQIIDSNTIDWNSNSTNLDSQLISIAPSSFDVPGGSALGSSTTSGFSVGLRSGVGLGLNTSSVNTTIGGSYNYSQSKENTKVSFIDINGDGLPDKVYESGSSIKYRSNLGLNTVANSGVFGTERTAYNLSDLNNTKSRTSTKGVDANIGVGGVGVGVGKSWNKTRTATDDYFTDFNGDGLIDVIAGGTVKFNSTDPWTAYSNPSHVIYSNNVFSTPNSIYSGGVNEALVDDLELESKDEIRAEHSQFDHVKVWEAPYTGSITIDSNAILLQSNTCNDNNYPNEFRLTIEKATNDQTNGNTTRISIGSLNEWPLSSSNTTQNLDKTLYINKGEKLFFRIHNKDYGCGGEVEWNPEITYTNTLNSLDEHNVSMNVFDAAQDFIIDNGGSWSPSNDDSGINGINFNLNLTPYQFSDDLRFVIEKTTYAHDISNPETNESYGQITGVITDQWVKTYNHNNGTLTGSTPSGFISISNPFTNGGNKSYSFRFYVESTSNVQWNAINWQPTILNQDNTIYYPPVSYTKYNDNVNENNYQINSSSLPNPVIDPNIINDGDNPLLTISHNMFNEDYNEFIEPFVEQDADDNYIPIEINWAVKAEINGVARTLHRHTFYLRPIECFELVFNDDYCDYEFWTEATGGTEITNMNSDVYSEFNLTKTQVKDIKDAGGRLFSAFYINDSDFGLNNTADITLNLHTDEVSNINYASFTEVTLIKPFFGINPTFYGLPYRGWGELLYNGGVKYDYNEDGTVLGFDPNIHTMETFPPHHNYEGNMDMALFDYEANSNPNQYDDSINNAVIRYTFYSQNNEASSYINSSIIYGIDNSNENIPAQYKINTSGQLTTLLGRFGEPNIFDLWTDPNSILDGSSFAGLKQRSLSKGNSTSGSLDLGGAAELSGTKSDAYSKVLNQYLDVNGDRYPDIVTNNNIQFTGMRGNLLPTLTPNGFASGGENEDRTTGATISGSSPNSTASDNNSTTSPTRTNVNSGINESEGESFNAKQWTDINGDGLLDKITITTSSVKVKLNTGYGFSDEILWGTSSNLLTSKRDNIGIGGGVGTPSWAAGFGAATSTTRLNAALIDVNGDGLPDLVKNTGDDINPEFTFQLNIGTGFETTGQQVFYNNFIDVDTSTTGNVYGSFTTGFYIQLLFATIKFTFTPTAGVNAGINEKQVTLQDIDGDGYVDILEKGTDNGKINAKLNQIGKTHLLKSVNLPLGGSWTVDYERDGNTYDLPQNKWALSAITTHDGFAGDSQFAPDETLTTISYENPKHDRREREFLGYGTVRVDQKDVTNGATTYRYTITDYHNENIYLKGLQKHTTLYDSSGNTLTESSTLYNIMNPEMPQVDISVDASDNYLAGVDESLLDYSRLFVAPVKTVSTSYEDSEGLSVEQQFLAYDGYGNLLTYKNLGDTYTAAATNDAYRTELDYYNPTFISLDNSTGFVEKIQVYRDNGNALLRERRAAYTPLGKLHKVTTLLNTNNDTNEVTLTYDSYGNVLSSTLNNGFTTTIGYDTVVHTFPVSVTNDLNETSSSEYNYLFGIPVFTTDINEQSMRTRIDNRGRLVEIAAPNEIDNNTWTIRMEYEGQTTIPDFNTNNYVINGSGSFEAIDSGDTPPTNAKHYALTKHNLENINTSSYSELETISLVDGLGKAIQLKKAQWVNDNGNGQLKWLVSGKEEKDAFGRVVKAYLPTSSTIGSSDFVYITGTNTIAPTLMSYDVKDRVVSVTQPDENQSATTTYGIEDGMFVTNTTNELNQTLRVFTDVRGRQRKTVQNDELTTQFYYNTVGEKVKVKNHQGYETHYEYDLAGRRIEERHPDYGLQTFTYDTNGNLIERQTSNLLLSGSSNFITYDYDPKNRLTNINYPLHPENNVSYTYGVNDGGDMENRNAVGRLYMQQDASGVQGFGYDKLGNLNKHLRGVAIAGRHTFWFFTNWYYDSFNRVQKIIYPDDEVVKYNYNSGGSLNSITRTIGNIPVENIVNSISYNSLGERTQITYGNGTSSSYTYDNRRRLNTLNHEFSDFSMLNIQNQTGITNQYSYDVLSNVESITTLNSENYSPSNGQLGGPISHRYTYDDYNRLVGADGRYTGPNDLTTPLLAQEYSLSMKYDLAHNILSKTQSHVQGTVENPSSDIETAETMVKTNYHLAYDNYATGVNIVQGQDGEFGYVQPHAPREIIEMPDDTQLAETDPEYKKKVIEYDANGNQTLIKQVVNSEAQGNAYEGVVQQEALILRQNLWDEEDRLRAVDLNPEENSPHQLAVYTYDVAGQRVVRYIPGRVDVKSNANNVSNNAIDEVMLYPSPLVTARALSTPGVAPQDNELVSSYTKHYYIGAERINSTLGTVPDLGLMPKIAQDQFMDTYAMAGTEYIVETANTGLTNTYLALGEAINLSSPVVGGISTRFEHDMSLYDSYWYHSDHLGSSSYISNTNGIVTQHMEYLSFGELLVDEHLNSYNTPYKFNGKELDEETGNYYYGARYYDPKWSIWLSVDPLARYNPVLEIEFYGDGQHNGGDFNNGNLNGYNYCYRNPIVYVDPNGKQVYFSNTGAYLGTGGRSNNIRVMQKHTYMTSDTFDADYAYNNSTTLSSFNYNDSQNVNMLKNVGEYFQEKIGFSDCGPIDVKDGKGSYMFVIGDGPEINITRDSGGIFQGLDNEYNFMNTLVHEDGHRRDGRVTNFLHLNNYLDEIMHDTWMNTTSDYKDDSIYGIVKYLNESVIKDGVPFKNAKGKMDELNSNLFEYRLFFNTKTKRFDSMELKAESPVIIKIN